MSKKNHKSNKSTKNQKAEKEKNSFKRRLAKVDALVAGEACENKAVAAGLAEAKVLTENQVLIKLDNSKLNQKPINQVVDELNADNPEINHAKSYLDVNEIGKGERLVFALNRLSLILERARIGDYVSMMGNTRGMLIKNFLAGIARGFGYGIGFVVLAAIAIYILNKVVDLGIPIIGNLVADILNYVDQLRSGAAIIHK